MFLDFQCFWIFTVFGQFIRGQSVAQRRMDHEAPRYPAQDTEPYLVLGS